VVLEFPFRGNKGSTTLEGEAIYRKVKSITVLHHLRYSKEKFSVICRVELNDSKDDVKEALVSPSVTQVQPLSQEADGSYTVYAEGRPLGWVAGGLSSMAKSAGVQMYDIFELQKGTLKASYLGSNGQIQKFLKGLARSGVGHKVLSMGDAQFSEDSPMYALTERQRKVIVSAFNLGYFEVPRRISVENLSRHVGLKKSAVNEHIRKAEGRLLNRIIKG
jgi:hypothetical protein